MRLNSTKCIAIFDDDTDILSICDYILSDQGWKVHTFNNCNQIIEKISGIQPDVILMDNWIPELGGISATRLLKQDEALKNIPVIYFSANNDIQVLASHAGADTYLAKPFDIEDLSKVINKVMAKKNQL